MFVTVQLFHCRVDLVGTRNFWKTGHFNCCFLWNIIKIYLNTTRAERAEFQALQWSSKVRNVVDLRYRCEAWCVPSPKPTFTKTRDNSIPEMLSVAWIGISKICLTVGRYHFSWVVVHKRVSVGSNHLALAPNRREGRKALLHPGDHTLIVSAFRADNP